MLQELIRESKEYIQTLDKKQMLRGGIKPRYPIMVVYLGKQASKTHKNIFSELYQIWPAYYQKILYLHMEYIDQEIQFSYWDGVQWKGIQHEKKEEILLKKIGNLLGEDFQDATRVRRHFIMDSGQMEDIKEYKDSLKLLSVLQELVPKRIYMDDILYILLDEHLNKTKISTALRNHLANFKKEKYPVESIVIISNQDANARFFLDWNHAYEILSLLMAQSNQQDANVSDKLYTEGIKCIAFSKVAKPVQEIAQVLVSRFLEEISQISGYIAISPEKIKNLIGIGKKGEFLYLEKYLEDHREEYLFTKEYLEYLPRETENFSDISELSYQKANQLTLHSIESYIQISIAKLLKNLREDREWIKEYEDTLEQNRIHQSISREEWIYLKNHEKEMKNCFHILKPSYEKPVMEVAKNLLTYEISNSKEIQEILLGRIRFLGEQAEEFNKIWNQCRNEIPTLRNILDQTIERFYTPLFQRYLDKYSEKIQKEFQGLRNQEDLKEFILSYIQDFIEQEKIFKKGFEAELLKRLNKRDNPIFVQNYIIQKLTIDIPIYFRSHFILKQELLSTISLRLGENWNSLFTAIERALENQFVYYYNIRSQDYAIAMKLIPVSAEDLQEDFDTIKEEM